MSSPTALLQNILNVVSRTEAHVAAINGTKQSDSNNINDVVAGSTNGNIRNDNTIVNKLDEIISIIKVKKDKKDLKNPNSTNNNVNQKLDTIISLMKGMMTGKIDKKDNKYFNEISKTFGAFGAFTANLLKLSKIPEKAKNGVIKLIGGVLEKIANVNPSKLKKNTEQLVKVGNVLKNFAISIAIFGGTMVAFSLVVPMIAKGALGFITVVAALSVSLLMISKSLQWGNKGFKDTSPLKTLKELGIAIALFGTTMVAFSFVTPLIAKGALGFITVVAALSVSIVMMGKALQWGSGGFKDTSPIKTLKHLILSIALTGLTMVAFSFAMPMILKGALGFAIVVGGLTGAILLMSLALGAKNKLAPTKDKTGVPGGTGPLADLAKLTWAAAGFMLAMIGVGYFWKQAAIGALTTTVSITALAGAAMLLGNKLVPAGSRNLFELSKSLAIFAGSMAVWTLLVQPRLSWEGIGMLGAVIGTMGLVGTVLGIPPLDLYAKAGATSLILLGAALATFAGGLAIYSQIAAPGLTWDNIAILGAVIGTMSLVGTGLGFIAPLVIAGAAALGTVGLALLPICGALSIFKKVNWTTNDSKNLTSAITSVTKSFGTALKDVKWKDLFFGVTAMANVGRSLRGIAEGIQAFANLTFNEYEYDEKTGKMKLINKVRLSDKDIIQTGINIGKVLGAITKPLADFGDLMSGKKSGAGLFKNIGNLVSMKLGISSMATVGNGLVSISKAVQDWANMTITEWVVQKDPQTGLNVLVPSNRRPIEDTEIDSAINNIKKVLETLTIPLIDFGEKAKKRRTRKGLEAFANVSGGLVNLADAVVAWSKLEYFEMEVVKDPQTGLNVLQPVGKPKKIDITTQKLAATHIGDVLDVLATPLANFGQQIGKRKIRKGLESLENISNNLTSVADMVAKWAKLEYTEMEVITDKDGNTSIQPARIGKLDPKVDIDAAINNIDKVLGAITDGVAKYADRSKDIKSSAKAITDILELQSPLSEWAKFLTTTFADGSHADSALNFKLWLFNTADPILFSMETRYKGLGNSIEYFGKKFKDFDKPIRVKAFSTFTDNILKLANVADPFEKFAKSFDLMSKSMGDFTTNFMKMSPASIKSYTEFTGSLTEFVKLKPAEFKARMDLVNEAMNVDKGINQSQQQSLNTQQSNNQNNVAQTKNTEFVQQDNKIIERLESLERIMNRVAATLTSGIEVNGRVAITNTDDFN